MANKNKHVVIVPQYFDARTSADDAFAIGVRQNNTVNQEVAYQEEADWVAAILEDGQFTPDDTFDNCHFNEKGSARMAEILMSFLTRSECAPKLGKFNRIAAGTATEEEDTLRR